MDFFKWNMSNIILKFFEAHVLSNRKIKYNFEEKSYTFLSSNVTPLMKKTTTTNAHKLYIFLILVTNTAQNFYHTVSYYTNTVSHYKCKHIRMWENNSKQGMSSEVSLYCCKNRTVFIVSLFHQSELLSCVYIFTIFIIFPELKSFFLQLINLKIQK